MKYLIFILALMSCKDKTDFIEITVAQGDNPAIGKKVIRLEENLNVFYGIENKNINKFDYYGTKIKSSYWDNIKKKLLSNSEFKQTNINLNFPTQDGQKMEINYLINNTKFNQAFELVLLSEKSNNFVDSLFIFNNISEINRIMPIKFGSKLLNNN